MSEDNANYQITARDRRAVDAPASDELAIARELAAKLAHEIKLTRKYCVKRVRLDIEDAEQLCQLLHDSLRTAEQLKR